MKLEFFIARKLANKSQSGFSDPIMRIAIVAVALALAVMIIAVAIVTGFQREIREKVIGFGGHIQITSFDSNESYETAPISREQPFLETLISQPEISHIQVFATKPGIIRTETDIEGIVLKGVDQDFDWSFFSQKLSSGSLLQLGDTSTSNGILISRKLASLLHLKPGDDARMYFIIDNLVRARRFNIEGIYNTGLEEFDKMVVLCDIRHIQRLNGWDNNQIAGFEVLINDFKQLDAIAEKVYQSVGYDLNAQSVKDVYPQIFDWLKLQDMNVIIVLTLMTLVALITMISALLIIILERTNTIGIFKALGYENSNIRIVFIIIAANITLKGMLWGNAIGLALAGAQKHFGLIKLSEESYYVSVVPIDIDWLYLLLLNAGTLIVCLAVLVIPSIVISSITPVKTIRFE
ncbi:MAG: FtsX-like permease family protein [Bacteroidales bacterium]|nr:FtsX-like permease family protein [Bacteroidales bacterium]